MQLLGDNLMFLFKLITKIFFIF